MKASSAPATTGGENSSIPCHHQPPLVCLPASIVCFSLCPFLGPSDVLSFRVSCHRTLELLHYEPVMGSHIALVHTKESHELWKILLRRDFGLGERSIDVMENEEWWSLTLRVEFPMANCTSVFGINPGVEEPLQKVETAFESWKGWTRASRRFYEDLPDAASSSRLIHAPYFQRAAKVWRQICEWLHTNETIGKTILRSFQRGLRCKDWDTSFHFEQGTQAAQAIYAFCGGQQLSPDLSSFDGLFGGYQAYNYYCNSHLVPPGMLLGDNKHMVVSQCNFSNRYRMPKLFAVNTVTGDMALLTPTQRLTRAVTVTTSPRGDEFLIWMEEFAKRLSSGQIGLGFMGSTPEDPPSITLYPRLLPSTSLPGPGEIPLCSHAVTLGVEVIGSAVYAPQAVREFGFIYSIRIQLVTQSADDNPNCYMYPVDRGFETCQLQSRHWKITNFETGSVNEVHGEGVIGMFPILSEGGYMDAGAFFPTTFQYQSCTGPIRRGSFGGTLEFVPGTIASPTGPPFYAELKPFLLDDNPSVVF
eukprot:scaffold10345_cov158-Cylindrotheca_fusiformis.AAC.1